jgi:hypothetical protein
MPARSALIAILILDRPLCLECIETKSSTTRAEVDRSLTAIAQSHLELRRSDDDRCRNCGEARLVFSLHRSMEMGNA